MSNEPAGFNSHRYDNSIVFGNIIGCTLDQLHGKAIRIITTDPERSLDDLLPSYPYTMTNE